MSQQGVTLKVLEAYTRDVGRGVVRIDYDAMDSVLLNLQVVIASFWVRLTSNHQKTQQFPMT